MVRDNFDDRPLAPDGLPVLVPPVQRRFDDLKQSELRSCTAGRFAQDASLHMSVRSALWFDTVASSSVLMSFTPWTRPFINAIQVIGFHLY
jgi:hypothetical protein